MNNICKNNEVKIRNKKPKRRIRAPRYFCDTFWGDTLLKYDFAIINETKFGAKGIRDNIILEYYGTIGQGKQSAYAVSMTDKKGKCISNSLAHYRLNKWYIDNDIRYMLKNAERYLFDDKGTKNGRVRVIARSKLNYNAPNSQAKEDKIIALTLNSVEDKIKKMTKSQIMKKRLLRITDEAISQNAIIDLETVSILLDVSIKAIIRCIKEYYQEENKIILLTGYNISNLKFRTIVEIIYLNKLGKSSDEISNIIKINNSKVNQYINDFSIISKYILENRTLYINKLTPELKLSKNKIRDNIYVYLELQSKDYLERE